MNRIVVVDRWDLPELESAREVMAFAKMRRRLDTEFAPWGGDALDDIFLLLFKARPAVTDVADVDSSHVVVHVLVSLLAANLSVQRLRQSTMRDLVGAATAAAKLAPAIAQAANEVAPADVKAVQAAESESEEWLRALAADRREALTDRASEVAETALEGLERTAEAIAEHEEQLGRAAETWGLGSGDMRRLSVPERLELAKRLDTDRVRQITDLFGRLRTALFAEQAEFDDVGVEPVDVELGGDLSRLVGSELLALELGELFEARLGEGALALYQMRGEERVGRGGIVLCVDGSGSMTQPCQGYTREMWASAFKLLLLQAAIRDGRALHVVNFGGPGELDYHRFVDPGERTPMRALESAAVWFGYGTDFVGPLRKTVEVLADESDRDCDIVFVSDGECAVSQRQLHLYRTAAKSRRARTWGVALGRTPGGLTMFCDRVFSIKDLTGGRELGELLNAVQT